MIDFIKEFIEDNIELIDSNNFEELYLIACDELGTLEAITDMTHVLLDAGIKPLNYLDFVPEGYLCKDVNIKELVLPEGIKRVEHGAFLKCSSIEKLTIPSSVEEIDRYAFASLDSLKTIYFNSKFCEIDGSAFAYSDSIEEIYYNGKMREWKTLMTQSPCEPLERANHIRCLDGEL